MEVLNFQDKIEKNVEKFLSLINDKEKRIRIISHDDADGITSAAIIVKVLKRLNLQYWLTNLKGFDENVLENLLKEEWDISFILDFGLNEEKVQKLEELNRDVFILDHHLADFKKEFRKVHIINSHLLNEDLSASGVCYFFGKAIDEKNKDLAYIAIIGLIGDFKKVDERILKDAIDNKQITVRRGLKVFGASTKPLHKALAFSNVFIPGISGDEKGALELIQQAGINIKENNRFRTLIDLNDEESKKLYTLIATRSGNGNFIDYIYLINSNGKIYDSKEMATMINACGNLGYSEAGIEACYGNTVKAEKVYNKYKKEIVSALRWFEKEKENNSEKVVEACNGKVWVINAGTEVKDTIIGVLTSMLANHYEDKILVGMAESDGRIKISARAKEIDVKEFLDKIFKDLKAECGGHERAAGGLINKEDRPIVIERIKSLLN
ncbi:MAG: DHH family phosphoesterase [Nanoarchaeota archaeon]|nr:DHH family phosphoesterase [Nanoarchaeota archaeon]